MSDFDQVPVGHILDLDPEMIRHMSVAPPEDMNVPAPVHEPDQPKDYTVTANLGLASTEELFREIIVRLIMNGGLMGAEAAVELGIILGTIPMEGRQYRTVDHID